MARTGPTHGNARIAAVDGAEARMRDVLPGRLDAAYTLTVVVGDPRLFNGAICAGTLAVAPEEQPRRVERRTCSTR